MPNQTVFLDWGGVMGEFLADRFLESSARAYHTTTHEVLRFINGPEGGCLNCWRGMECGMSGSEINERFSKYFGKNISSEDFRRAFCAGIQEPDWYRLGPFLKKLRASKIKLGLVSNINEEHMLHIERHYRYALWDIPSWHRFYSCKVGIRKDASGRMLEYICERCGIRPDEIILIDDRPENIEGARKIGARGILFLGFHEAEYELRQMGLQLKDV